MEVLRVPIDDLGWRQFTSSHPTASPFHLPAWAALIGDCYRFDVFVLTLRDADGEIRAGLPTAAIRSPLGRLRWVSLPFSDDCPVLARPDVAVEEAVAALAEHVGASQTRCLEVRCALPAADNVYPIKVGYRHLLKLPQDPANLHPHRNFRQRRNQAIRRGVHVTLGNATADIQAFYHLHTLTRRRLGVPVQPQRLFSSISDRIFANGHGFVATATLDDEVLAACLYLTHNGTMVAKYAASDPSRPDTGASHLIHWEVMSTACAEGYHTYDLGRSDLDADGLRAYKIRMGAEEHPLIYTHIARRPSGNRRPGVIDGVARRVIRHSPQWVCRATGDVLYRWSA